MATLRMVVAAALLCTSAAIKRCDMCRCQLAQGVLILNCSDSSRTRDSQGALRLPYPESYASLKFESMRAEFEHNRIASVPRLNLVDATNLSLAHNNIARLEPISFLRMRKLRTLDLRDNKLDELQGLSLKGLTRLQNLDLSQNNISSLEDGALIELGALTTLSLANNHLEALDEKALASSSLRDLDLSHNNIARFEAGALQGLTGLETLSLAHNAIDRVDEFLLAPLGTLRMLDLSHNSITRLEKSALTKLGALMYLSLEKNALESFNISLPAGLQVLRLGRNRLRTLDAPLPPRLRELRVEDNALHALSLGNGFALWLLNVSYNLLGDFPPGAPATLEELDLSYNRLTTVPRGVVLPALRRLSLDGNPLPELRFPSTSCGRLQWLSASAMDELRELRPGALPSNCSCLALRVAHNPRLVTVDPAALQGAGLCSLDLSHNALSALERGSLQWDALKAVDLQGNPWACTCALQWVLDTLLPHAFNSTPHLLYDLRCAAPAPLRGKRLVHFHNWGVPALCGRPSEQIRASDQSDEVSVSLDGSDAMLGVVAGLATLGVALVGLAFYLQRRRDRMFRIRNRRL